MINVFLRTVILYIIIVALMRLTGKRQIGQLELTELVTAFMVSELAANPISDNSVPLLYGIIPAMTLVSLEVFLSYISLKSKTFRRMVAGNALALINKGNIDIKQMNNARITVEELLSAMRAAGISCMSNVEYAFLEPNGTISVIPKASENPPTAKDMGISVSEPGIEHAVIVDGNINYKELQSLGLSENWMYSQLKKQGFNDKSQVFYMGVNDLKEVFIVKNKKKGKNSK